MSEIVIAVPHPNRTRNFIYYFAFAFYTLLCFVFGFGVAVALLTANQISGDRVLEFAAYFGFFFQALLLLRVYLRIQPKRIAYAQIFEKVQGRELIITEHEIRLYPGIVSGFTKPFKDVPARVLQDSEVLRTGYFVLKRANIKSMEVFESQSENETNYFLEITTMSQDPGKVWLNISDYREELSRANKELNLNLVKKKLGFNLWF